jgi:hypothetical protein
MPSSRIEFYTGLGKYKEVPGMIDYAVKYRGWKKGDFISQAIKEYFTKTSMLHDPNVPYPGGIEAKVEALMPSIWDPPSEWNLKNNNFHIYSTLTREQNTHLRLFCDYLPNQLDEAADRLIGPIDEQEENTIKRLQSYDWFKAKSEEEQKALVKQKIEEIRPHKDASIRETYNDFIIQQLIKKRKQNQQQEKSQKNDNRIQQWHEIQKQEIGGRGRRRRGAEAEAGKQPQQQQQQQQQQQPQHYDKTSLERYEQRIRELEEEIRKLSSSSTKQIEEKDEAIAQKAV